LSAFDSYETSTKVIVIVHRKYILSSFTRSRLNEQVVFTCDYVQTELTRTKRIIIIRIIRAHFGMTLSLAVLCYDSVIYLLQLA